MASDLILCTQHYTHCKVCAPSRSSLMIGQTTTELYKISKDIDEANNVANEHHEQVTELEDLMNLARTESEVFFLANNCCHFVFW